MSATAWRVNPFHILEIRPDASHSDIERAGQRLLALLSVGGAAVARYATPYGSEPRTSELVRWALQELRVPERRVMFELFAGAAGPRSA